MQFAVLLVLSASPLSAAGYGRLPYRCGVVRGPTGEICGGKMIDGDLGTYAACLTTRGRAGRGLCPPNAAAGDSHCAGPGDERRSGDAFCCRNAWVVLAKNVYSAAAARGREQIRPLVEP